MKKHFNQNEKKTSKIFKHHQYGHKYRETIPKFLHGKMDNFFKWTRNNDFSIISSEKTYSELGK